MSAQGAAAQWLEKEYGGRFSVQKGKATVTTTASRIVGNDPDAVALIMLNLGANTVFADVDNDPSTTEGVQMNANGGSVSMDVRNDFLLPTYDWWAVTDTGSTTIYYIRLRRFVKSGA